MLIKEYRICLPLSVDEYRIAQLYMIQKKSREESSGEGSGVEILVNEPYTNGPGGNGGQYTQKIYHIDNHLPGWFRSILPKSARIVEEEAWNAYPYTKTVYKCPFIEKFTLEIETVYHNDGGTQENVFNLSNAELRNRVVDYIDIVRDPISSSDYKEEEDPKLFQSQKTNRGPLSDNWRQEYINSRTHSDAIVQARGKESSVGNEREDGMAAKKCVMCSYKLCRVEFRYWGLQGKIERFIHDIGLRKTMLRAHRQAWTWQDEYYGLTLDDIRRLERETQLALQRKMAGHSEDDDEKEEEIEGATATNDLIYSADITNQSIKPARGLLASGDDSDVVRRSFSSTHRASMVTDGVRHRLSSATLVSASSRFSCSSPRASSSGALIEALQTDDSSDEEFFDAYSDEPQQLSLSHLSSVRNVAQDGTRPLGDAASITSCSDSSVSVDESASQRAACSVSILLIVLHGGASIDSGQTDQHIFKNADLSTFRSTFNAAIASLYPSIVGRIAIRMVSCPPVGMETLSLLASLSPFGHSPVAGRSTEAGGLSETVYQSDIISGSAVLFLSSLPDYSQLLDNVTSSINSVYDDFVSSDEGRHFRGEVYIVGDSVGSLLGYDILCRCTRHFTGDETSPPITSAGVLNGDNENSLHRLSASHPNLVAVTETMTEDEVGSHMAGSVETRRLQLPSVRLRHLSNSMLKLETEDGHQWSCGGGAISGMKLKFNTSEMFMLGSPLGLVLAYRKLCAKRDPTKNAVVERPHCRQVYNLFYPAHPLALRIEPLLHSTFSLILPVKVPICRKFTSEEISTSSYYMADVRVGNKPLFASRSPSSGDRSSFDTAGHSLGDRGTHSDADRTLVNEETPCDYESVMCHWWGDKRVDYAVNCPVALHDLPASVLPHVLHASFWESNDSVTFMLRQIVGQDYYLGELSRSGPLSPTTLLSDTFDELPPVEKWLKRRTTMKVKAGLLLLKQNMTANHRANDVIVLVGEPQVLAARFMYGPLDVVSLSGEKVDIYMASERCSGKGMLLGTEVTDSNGRLTYRIQSENKLPEGIHSVKMVVRGDRSFVEFKLAVLPPGTETVVFSIDGSFAASMSIMGSDPRVRPGAVDIVRHWRERDYLVMYISARPDIQHRKVVDWLAQHRFPRGMVSFVDGLVANPLSHKSNFLRQLINMAKIVIHAAYGSSKDISVYQSVGLQPDQMFIIGKVSKKQHSEATIITDYTSHLNELAFDPRSRRAVTSLRLAPRLGCFTASMREHRKKKPVKHVRSLPLEMTDNAIQTSTLS